MEGENTEVQNHGEDGELLHAVAQQKTVETEKYPGIRLVSKFTRIIGIFLFVLYFILAFMGALGDGGLFYFLNYMATGIIFLIIGFLLGDLLQILVDIEKNTRK